MALEKNVKYSKFWDHYALLDWTNKEASTVSEESNGFEVQYDAVSEWIRFSFKSDGGKGVHIFNTICMNINKKICVILYNSSIYLGTLIVWYLKTISSFGIII